MRKAIAERLQNCGLELHPEKTKIVYCKDDESTKDIPNEKFDFLGYTFRPRRSKNRKGTLHHSVGGFTIGTAMRDTIRSWNLPKRSDKAIDDLSHMFNRSSGLAPLLRTILSLGALSAHAPTRP